MKVKFVGFGGNMDIPCYECDNGKLYFDENNGRNGLCLYTGAWRDECDEICGEPNEMVTGQIECDEPFVRHIREHDYMMLGRLQSDCDYFLGNGNGYESHLYYKDVDKHCDEMEKLYNSFSESDKPEWITLEQIEKYRTDMLELRYKGEEIMTIKEKEVIKDNLRAYTANFGYIHIEKADYGNGFYVFTSEERKETGSWTQFCYNIDYLNGWLYGAVQAVNGIMKPIEKESANYETTVL